MSPTAVALCLFALTLAVGWHPHLGRTSGGIARGISWFAVSAAASGLLLLPAAVRAGQVWFVAVELVVAIWVVVLGIFAARWRAIDALLRRQRLVTTVLLLLETCWLASAVLLLQQLADGSDRILLAGGALVVAAAVAWRRAFVVAGPSTLTAVSLLALALTVFAARFLRPEAYRVVAVDGDMEPLIVVALLLLGLARETVGLASRYLTIDTGQTEHVRMAAWTHAVLRIVLIGTLYTVGSVQVATAEGATGSGLQATLAAFAGFGPASSVALFALAALLVLALASWVWALSSAGMSIIRREQAIVRGSGVLLIVMAAAFATTRFVALRPVWAEAVDLVYGATMGWVAVRRAHPLPTGWLVAVVAAALLRPWTASWLPLAGLAVLSGVVAAVTVPGRRAES
ncbi:MAG: hypothetical protein D6761_13590 [Candidatus Dadabacteria bacterium]|nr:MAG: hypothetical protein D6761_13590 [Candidatus Dadabacteria bacterium]